MAPITLPEARRRVAESARPVREGRIGRAQALLYRARDATAVALERLAADPLVFLCPPGDGRAECDLARASVVRT